MWQSTFQTQPCDKLVLRAMDEGMCLLTLHRLRFGRQEAEDAATQSGVLHSVPELDVS